MFFEDGPLASDYFSKFGSYPSWGSTNLADYVMTNWWSPWFDSVPVSMLYQPLPGRPIINIWTAHPTGMTNNPALDGVRVKGWPADGDPAYKNSPYADSFMVMLMYEGKLQPV